MSLDLYHYWRSSCSWRLRWALAYKGIDYAAHPVNLLLAEQRAPDYLAINASGSVPTLLIAGKAYTQSLALIEYLEELQPEPPLLPQQPLARLRVRELAQIIACDTQPLQNLRVMRAHSPDSEVQKDWARQWISAGLAVFEQRLGASWQGPWAAGANLSMADLALVPQVYNAKRFGVDMTPLPHCESIYRAALTLPTCLAASPELQSGSS